MRALAQYLWPLRVPLVSGSALVGLQWLAFRPGATRLLSGIFDPVADWTLAIVTALALFNAWSIVVIGRLILAYGADRLGLPRTTWQFFPVPKSTWMLGALLALPVIGRTFWYAMAVAPSGVGRFRGMLVAALVGAAAACALLFASLWLGERIDRQAPRIRTRIGASGLYDRFLAWFSRRRWLSAGFIAVDREGRYQPRLARGHGLAFFLALGSLALYVATGILTRNIDNVVLASALTYVLLLQLVLTWALGLAAFLLDRTRAPLAVYFVLWIVVVDTVIDRVFSTDHIYRTVELAAAPPARATPSALLKGPEPAVLIAVSGGGIQAAAWTARVLTGLKEESGFESHVRFISAVSGGSVGAMNFLAFTPDCGPAVDPGTPDVQFDANTASEASSLHAVGRGLVFKDLPRTVLPFFSTPYVDRGSQLEDAWKREARLRKPYPDAAALLSSWRHNVAERRCPGVVFNCHGGRDGATDALCDRRAAGNPQVVRLLRALSGPGCAGDHGGQAVVRLSLRGAGGSRRRRWREGPLHAPGRRRLLRQLWRGHAVGVDARGLDGPRAGRTAPAASGHRNLRLGVLQRARAGRRPLGGRPPSCLAVSARRAADGRRRDADRGAAGDQPHLVASPETVPGRRTTSASSRSRCPSAPATRRFRGT